MLEPGETVARRTLWKNDRRAIFRWRARPRLHGSRRRDLHAPGHRSTTARSPPARRPTAAIATGDCFQLAVSTPRARPATHWDAPFTGDPDIGAAKIWTLHIGDSFTDVPALTALLQEDRDAAAQRDHRRLHGDDLLSRRHRRRAPRWPSSSPRGSPAAARVPASGRRRVAYNCVAGGVSLFSDVSPTDIFCKHVHYIAAQNVTLGLLGGHSTARPTTSPALEMAAFIAKAVVAPGGGAAIPTDLRAGSGHAVSPTRATAGSPNLHFTDVPATDTFCKHVHYLWAKGIIAGCSATNLLPAEPGHARRHGEVPVERVRPAALRAVVRRRSPESRSGGRGVG